MANHKSSEKRARQSEAKKVHNKYFVKTAKTAIKKLKTEKDKKEATELYPKVVSMLDKLAKKNLIHKNKASNLKSKLLKQIKNK